MLLAAINVLSSIAEVDITDDRFLGNAEKRCWGPAHSRDLRKAKWVKLAVAVSLIFFFSKFLFAVFDESDCQIGRKWCSKFPGSARSDLQNFTVNWRYCTCQILQIIPAINSTTWDVRKWPVISDSTSSHKYIFIDIYKRWRGNLFLELLSSFICARSVCLDVVLNNVEHPTKWLTDDFSPTVWVETAEGQRTSARTCPHPHVSSFPLPRWSKIERWVSKCPSEPIWFDRVGNSDQRSPAFGAVLDHFPPAFHRFFVGGNSTSHRFPTWQLFLSFQPKQPWIHEGNPSSIFATSNPLLLSISKVKRPSSQSGSQIRQAWTTRVWAHMCASVCVYLWSMWSLQQVYSQSTGTLTPNQTRLKWVEHPLTDGIHLTTWNRIGRLKPHSRFLHHSIHV